MQVAQLLTDADRAFQYARRHAMLRLAERHTPQRLAELEHFEHPLASRLAKVLRGVRQASPAANRWASKVESQRRRLLEDKSPLSTGELRGPYDEGMTVARACRASRKPADALVLYTLVEGLGPSRVLELGTNVGISSSYMAAALSEMGQGRVVTLEASPGRSAVAKEVHQRLGLQNVDYVLGLFDSTLESALTAPVDLAFIDGHHQYEPTLDYFDRIHRKSTGDVVFVFDDIRWTSGMVRAWRTLQRDPRLKMAIDLGGMGIGVSTQEPGHRGRLVTRIIAA